jgi:hypothetical protein
MRDWLYEFAMVLEISAKTRWAIYLGFGLFFSITIFGHYQVANFELQGVAQGYQQKFAKHYDKAAFGALFSFMGLAYKHYKKDRKRLWG